MKNFIKTILQSTGIFIIAAFIFPGCSAPKKCTDSDLEIPKSIMAGRYADSLCVADIHWTNIFTDTTLQDIIRRTLDNNKNMLAAVARIQELEELHRVAKAGFFPSLSARGYTSREENNYSGTDSKISIEPGLKASLSWEIDFFGRIRWANKQALAQYMSSVEAQRALQMTLVASAATAYFELIALDNELEIVYRTLETRRDNVKHTKMRFEGGLTTEIPYQQAQVEFARTASLVPDLQKKIELKKNEISLLTGEFPSEIKRGKISSYETIPDVIHIGIPSKLLQRRPDIRAAEQSMQAAAAKAGIAWADRFPQFTITLQAGLENNQLDKFLMSPWTYMIGEIASPVFAFGKKKAQYEASIKAYDQEKYKYEQKVLEVFNEVNNAVVSYNSAKEKTLLMGNLKESAKKYVDLTMHQQQNGVINYIDVLDAQRSYFNAEIDLSNAIRDEFLAMIQLYKSLGGGWNTDNEESR